jgi:hypothetical protein
VGRQLQTAQRTLDEGIGYRPAGEWSGQTWCLLRPVWLPQKSQLLRGFDVNKSLKPKTGATPGQCYRRPPGRGMGSSKHFRFVLQWRQPFLSASLLKPFGGSGSLPASGTLQDGHGIPAPPHRRACAPFQIQSWWSSGRYGSFFNRRGDAADNSRALPRPRNRD